MAVVQSKSSPTAGSKPCAHALCRAEQEHHKLGGMVQCLIAYNIEKYRSGALVTDGDFLEIIATAYDVEIDFEYFMP